MHLDEAAVARFVQGLRSSEDAREIRKHLSGCADCRKKVSEFGQIRDLRATPANGNAAEATRGLPQARLPPPLPGRDKDDDAATRGVPSARSSPSGGRHRDDDDAATAALPKDRPKATPMPPGPDVTADDGRRTMPIPGAEPAPNLDRGAMLGRYLVLHPLGEGGMGVVYSAYDPELDRKVAVKLISAGASEELAGDGQARLQREAQAMARVSHPNVIAVYDVGTLNNRVFVAMELVEGGTLKDWIRQKKRSTKEILRVFVEAGRGLAAAHAVGLVHRDFKPENVLISKKEGGRAQVTDFGLARLAGSSDEKGMRGAALTSIPKRVQQSADDRGRLLDAQITQHGLVMGTPQYMSPEQHLGKDPDARSDQFSFCAALYWALYGKRPFDPVQLAAAAVKLDEQDDRTRADRAASPAARAAIGKGVIQEPPKEVQVPSDVKKAMLRGLSVDPAQRFPNMEELLARLAPRESSAQRRWVGAAAGVAVVVAASAVYLSRPRVCQGTEALLGGIWDQARKDAVLKQFASSGLPIAEEAFRLTAASLDEYARGWANQRTEACVATRVRGDQTEKILELRTVCLDRRLKELNSLASLLAQADKETVEKAYGADFGAQLSSLKSCADVELLTTQVSVPQDPVVRGKIESIRGLIADARARWAAGKFLQGLQVADGAAAQAKEVAYNPLLAEALYIQARLQDQTGKTGDAAKTLLQAIRAGEAGRQDEARAESMVQLVSTMTSLRKYDGALEWSELAQGLLERLTGHEEMQVDLFINTGRLHLLAGNWADSLQNQEKALAILNKSDPNSWKRAKVLDAIASVRTRASDPKIRDADEAIKAGLQSIAIYEKTKGKRHPLSGTPHANIITPYMTKQDYASALEHAQIAYEIFLTTYGPESAKVRNVTESFAAIYFGLKRYRESLEAAQRAYELNKKLHGPDSPEMRFCLETYGKALVALNRPQEAIPVLEKTLKWFEADKGSDLDDLGDTRFALAQALRDARKDQDRAVALATRAHEDYVAGKQPKKADEVERWLRAGPSPGTSKRRNALGSRG